MPERAYEVLYRFDPSTPVVRFGPTVAKVRYFVWSDAKEWFPNIRFGDIGVRFIGKRETPREIAERTAAQFNRRYPIGTRVELQAIIGSDDYARCSVIREPGAYVADSGHVLVKVPGDSYVIEAVHPIVEVPNA